MSHWRRREPVSVRDMVWGLLAASALFWLALANIIALVTR